MANYGMKVSRQGYDVKTCADNQLLFSSSFRSSLIYSSGQYTVNDYTVNNTFTTHSLGYIPVSYVVARNMSLPSSTDMGHRQQWDMCAWDGNTPYPVVVTDSTKIYYKANQQVQQTFFAYYILPYDLETAYVSDNIDITEDTQGAISNDYGYKVSKEGNEVEDATLINLQSFSGTSLAGYPVRQHIIQEIGNTVANNGATTAIPHGLGYKPMHIFYLKTSSDPVEYCQHFLGFDVEVVGGIVTLTEKVRTWADNTYIYFYNNTGSNRAIAYVIFKDPMF